MQFERLKLLIGEDNLNKISSKNILVLGLGGVGSYVVEALVRSGVLNITIVDFDKIDITNLNRQIIANLSNIGCYKTDETLKRILSINSNVNVKKITEFIDSANINLLFSDNYDYIIDCCDFLPLKKLLIKECLERKIKFVVCTGTGNKLDPSKLEITDIRKTSYDPICKKLREFVKKERLNGKITCCYSKEAPVKTNTNTISSTAFVPASAGLLISSYIICDIIKK